jgi:hypothetical protein
LAKRMAHGAKRGLTTTGPQDHKTTGPHDYRSTDHRPHARQSGRGQWSVLSGPWSCGQWSHFCRLVDWSNNRKRKSVRSFLTSSHQPSAITDGDNNIEYRTPRGYPNDECRRNGLAILHHWIFSIGYSTLVCQFGDGVKCFHGVNPGIRESAKLCQLCGGLRGAGGPRWPP